MSRFAPAVALLFALLCSAVPAGAQTDRHVPRDFATIGDADAMQAKIMTFVDDVVQQLHPAYPALVTDRCLVKKLHTVGDATAAKLGCFDEAFKLTPIPNCLALPQNTLTYTWNKLEDTLYCSMVEDSTNLEAMTDDFVADIIASLDPQ